MTANDERIEQARGAVEAVIAEYQDVFTTDDSDAYVNRTPILGHWVLLVTHDDIQDPRLLSTYRMVRLYQSTHETVGMLYLNIRDLEHFWAEHE